MGPSPKVLEDSPASGFADLLLRQAFRRGGRSGGTARLTHGQGLTSPVEGQREWGIRLI